MFESNEDVWQSGEVAPFVLAIDMKLELGVRCQLHDLTTSTKKKQPSKTDGWGAGPVWTFRRNKKIANDVFQDVMHTVSQSVKRFLL